VNIRPAPLAPLPLLVLLTGCALGAADDPALVAAERALADRQPLQAVQLLRGHPGLARPGAERLALARAQLALGRGDEALAALGADGGAAWIMAWPEPLRGAAAQCAGEAAIARGDAAAARALLEAACRSRGADVAVDRCLALLGELCVQLGDGAAATAYLRALWEGWPRSPWRGHGGLLLARQLAPGAPDEARAVLSGVRLAEPLAAADRLAAAELLCRLLLERHPGSCLVAAEQEQARLDPRDGGHGQLPLYRALALAALDAREGLVALEALPEGLRADPAAQAALARLRGARGGEVAEELVLERARAEAELGRVPAARALLEPLAMRDPAALAALVQLPGVDPLAYLGSAASVHPLAALALGRALATAGHQREAWPLLGAALASREAGKAPEVPLAALLYWSAQAARVAEPAAWPRLQQRLLALAEPGVESGLAWCDEAQRREGAGGDAQDAWARAARALPADHPWRAAAAWRAARALVESGARLAEARELVERPAWAGTAPDQQRCRFLLVQIAERLGDMHAALSAAESLLPLADPGQRDRLTAIIARLRAAQGNGPAR
jgi:hypothetical protein